jgi:hypothetical protein
VAVNGDPFDRVLPGGRGRGRNCDREDENSPRSAMDRARVLVAALERHRGSVIETVRIERRMADELGLDLRPGTWVDVGDGERWALSAIYYDEEFIGFSLMADQTWLLLRPDRPQAAGRYP